MENQVVKAGDVLLYKVPRGHWYTKVFEGLIVDGEKLEDGKHKQEYYHIAVAISDKQKIEANGVDVAIDDIEYDGSFDSYTMPFSQEKIEEALEYIKGFQGEPYDWTLIVDDALRYLSDNILHLPLELVAEKEKYEKICSTFAVIYLIKLGLIKQEDIHKYYSPEDDYLLIKTFLESM